MMCVSVCGVRCVVLCCPVICTSCVLCLCAVSSCCADVAVGTSRSRSRRKKAPGSGGVDGELREYHRLGIRWRPKISDMGLSKQLSAGVSSFAALSGAPVSPTDGFDDAPGDGNDDNDDDDNDDDLSKIRPVPADSSSLRVVGTTGWQAPELLHESMGRFHTLATVPSGASGGGDDDDDNDDNESGGGGGGGGGAWTSTGAGAAVAGGSGSGSGSGEARRVRDGNDALRRTRAG